MDTKKKTNEAVVELFMFIDDEGTRRKVFDLFSFLEEDYRGVLARELTHYITTGHETVWVKSRLLLRFYCIAKRLMGFPADEADFDLKFYHYIEKYRNSTL